MNESSIYKFLIIKKTRIHHAGFLLLRSLQSIESALAQLTQSRITYDRDEQLAS